MDELLAFLREFAAEHETDGMPDAAASLRKAADALEASTTQVRKAVQMLEAYGISQERARHNVANGIEVLATRYKRQCQSNDVAIAGLTAKLDAVRERAESWVQPQSNSDKQHAGRRLLAILNHNG